MIGFSPQYGKMPVLDVQSSGRFRGGRLIGKCGVFENCPSKTHSKLNLSTCIRGAVEKQVDCYYHKIQMF